MHPLHSYDIVGPTVEEGMAFPLPVLGDGNAGQRWNREVGRDAIPTNTMHALPPHLQVCTGSSTL